MRLKIVFIHLKKNKKVKHFAIIFDQFLQKSDMLQIFKEEYLENLIFGDALFKKPYLAKWNVAVLSAIFDLIFSKNTILKFDSS